jgi:hypothetical protein
LEEERQNDITETISLKLNIREREELESDKELLDIGPDSAAVKLLMEIGRKVLRDTFPGDRLRYLVSLKRVRYDARKRKSRGRVFPKVVPKESEE